MDGPRRLGCQPKNRGRSIKLKIVGFELQLLKSKPLATLRLLLDIRTTRCLVGAQISSSSSESTKDSISSISSIGGLKDKVGDSPISIFMKDSSPEPCA
jgi:hypothetical protein